MRSNEPFETLLRRYRGLLFSLCRRYSRRGLEVDDLMQEAAVALWRDNARLQAMSIGPAQAALVWKIARNAMIDTLRRNRPSEALPAGFDLKTEENDAVKELYDRVEKMVEPDRTLLTMQLQGYSYDEIAEATSLTVKNVSVRLVRAKERLKKAFEE